MYKRNYSMSSTDNTSESDSETDDDCKDLEFSNKLEAEKKEEFSENWYYSQFWYDDKTAELLEKEVLRICPDNGKICCMSCPTVFRRINKNVSKKCQVLLLDVDEEKFKQFENAYACYDFNRPKDIKDDFKNCDVVIADTPHLKTRCIDKMFMSIKIIMKESGKIILCTGSKFESYVKENHNMKKSDFKIDHTSKLQNPYACFINY